MSVYSQDQNDWNFQRSTVENFWNRVRNKAIETELNSYGVDKEKLILEIGCGVGVVGRHLLERKFNYWGCEPSDVPYILCNQERFEKKFHHELPVEFRQRVKVLILADVIEHIEDDQRFLTEIVGAFPEFEIMLITAPSYSLLWNENDNLVGHHRRYTTKSLSNLIDGVKKNSKKLRIISNKHMFLTLSILMLISKLKNFLTGNKAKLSVIKHGSVVDKILEKISNLELKIQLPFGSSIMLLILNEKNS